MFLGSRSQISSVVNKTLPARKSASVTRAPDWLDFSPPLPSLSTLWHSAPSPVKTEAAWVSCDCVAWNSVTFVSHLTVSPASLSLSFFAICPDFNRRSQNVACKRKYFFCIFRFVAWYNFVASPACLMQPETIWQIALQSALWHFFTNICYYVGDGKRIFNKILVVWL